MTSIDIILFCYKQEQYIEQALRSIYMQELPKDVTARIIVADDCSPDDTLNIIKHHAQESPFPMEFLPEESNMGISKNYRRSFAATNADYVAILEGDDYWLPNHLMQHIEFLQAHTDSSMSMNEIICLDEGTNEMTKSSKIKEDNINYITFDITKQIVNGNQLGNLSACVFRGEYVRLLPDDLFDLDIADWMIGIMMAQYGLLSILKETTSVYLVKPSGEWAGKSRWQSHWAMIEAANAYDKYQKGKYHNLWKQFKRNRWSEVRENWIHYMPIWMKVCVKKVLKIFKK